MALGRAIFDLGHWSSPCFLSSSWLCCITMAPVFLGIDVGTQSLRAALVDPEGNCRAWATHEIDTVHAQPGWAEQDAAAWWEAARRAIGKAVSNAGVSAAQIASFGLDCTACTVLPCTAAGEPLRNALLWMDQRAYREAEEISA